MEAVLSFDNILGEGDIESLFLDPEEEETNTSSEDSEETEETEEAEKEEKKKEKKDITEVVDSEELFEETPESVGNDKKKDKEEGEKEDAITDEGGDTSPNNFYSSIASALAVDGVFPNLDEETIKKADTAEAFSDLIEAEVNARFDEKQKRISKALEEGVEPSEIKKYESTLAFLAGITEADIAEESDKGEDLRRRIIYFDFINKGYTPEKAQKLTTRTIDAGTDIEDAKESLQSNKEFYQNAYNRLLKEAEAGAKAQREERKKQEEKLRDSIMKDKQLFGTMELSNDIRKKVYDNIAKPIYKDPETGDYLTAIQKYELEHRSDFLKYAGLIFTLTDGFKDFESFTKGKVKKEVRKGLRELEHTINSTVRTPGGSLKMVTNVKEDPESFIGKGLRLDI